MMVAFVLRTAQGQIQNVENHCACGSVGQDVEIIWPMTNLIIRCYGTLQTILDQA